MDLHAPRAGLRREGESVDHVPERILLSWQEFQKAIDADGNSSGLEAEIVEMLTEISDPELDKSVRGYIKEYPAKIVEAHNRVSARLAETRQKKEVDHGVG